MTSPLSQLECLVEPVKYLSNAKKSLHFNVSVRVMEKNRKRFSSERCERAVKKVGYTGRLKRQSPVTFDNLSLLPSADAVLCNESDRPQIVVIMNSMMHEANHLLAVTITINHRPIKGHRD